MNDSLLKLKHALTNVILITEVIWTHSGYRGVTYAYLEGTQRHPATDIIELAVVAGRYRSDAIRNTELTKVITKAFHSSPMQLIPGPIDRSFLFSYSSLTSVQRPELNYIAFVITPDRRTIFPITSDNYNDVVIVSGELMKCARATFHTVVCYSV
jgi:hypothetical protein